MKSTGIVRKLDELGRITLPVELRRNLGMQEGTPIEIFIEDKQIILQKYQPSNACIITGVISNDNIEIAGKVFSLEGIKQVANALAVK